MSLWLAKDQKSNEVVALQNALNLALQPGKALVLDGIFGPLTEGATRAFQKCQGLTADGIAGPHTLAGLFTGYDATVKVAVAPAGASAGAREAFSPYSFDRPKPRPPLSFGTVCVLQREAMVRSWCRQEAPKAALDLPPLYRPELVLERQALPQTRRFSIDYQQPHQQAEVDGEGVAEVEVALEGGAKVSKEAKEVELEFSYRVLINRFKPYLVPSLSLLPTPDGRWQARAELSLTPFKIFEKEWKLWTFEMSPLLRATVTLPAFFGRERAAEMGFSAGLSTEITRGVGRRGTRIFLGGTMGILGTLELDQHRIGGHFKRPEGGFFLATGVRF
jgi:hypothetical protein